MLKDANAFSSFAVDDTAKAKEFYSETLGLEVGEDPKMPMLLNLKLGDTFIMIYPRENHVPAEFTVLNFRVKDIGQTVTELTDKGVEFKKYDDGPVKTDERGISTDDRGPRIAWFTDPAGNILSVIQE